MHLVTSLYHETNKARREEYLFALQKNVEREEIKKITVFYDTKALLERDTFQDKLSSFEKVEIIQFAGRPTYDQLFTWANKHVQGIFIIVNGDIFFDQTLALINEVDFTKKKKCIVLSRWDFSQKGNPPKLIDREDGTPNHLSADAWIFETPIILIKKCPEYLGTYYCDSVLNTVLTLSGYQVYNPCHDIKAYHIHSDPNVKSQDDVERIQARKTLWRQLHIEYGMQPLTGIPWCRHTDVIANNYLPPENKDLLKKNTLTFRVSRNIRIFMSKLLLFFQ